MDSNEGNILDRNETLKADVANVQNGRVSSDSEDDEFFNDLFTVSAPTYTATDTAPLLDDSDSDNGVSELLIKFYVDKCNLVPMARYGDSEYRIGFLDLTQDEYSCLGVISKTSVELSINERHIFLHDNIFNIKRISERKISSKKNEEIETLFEMLNLVLQFSITEPFFTKYEENSPTLSQGVLWNDINIIVLKTNFNSNIILQSH